MIVRIVVLFECLNPLNLVVTKTGDMGLHLLWFVAVQLKTNFVDQAEQPAG